MNFNWQEILKTPVQYIKGVGPYYASLLEKVQVTTLEDLLYHVPHRYQDRRQVYSIREAPAGVEGVIKGELLTFGESRMGRRGRRIFQAIFSDESGHVLAKWFNYRLSFMEKQFKKGRKAYLSGKLDLYHGEKQIVHPELEWLEAETEGEDELSGGAGILPVYPATEGLKQRNLRRIIQTALEKALPELSETLPESIRNRLGLLSYLEGLKQIHSPSKDCDVNDLNEGKSQAHRRMIFDEFFFLELGLALKRQGNLQEKGIAIPFHPEILRRFYESLPFQPTQAQSLAVEEMSRDLSRGKPMHRLLQGDVGSGKTVVAAALAFLCLQAGHQVCLMAPTEILAEQHARTFSRWLTPFGISITLLKSDLTGSMRKDRLEKIAGGEVRFVVGTHALIQGEVEFKSLALAVVDEQHRFGVLQRAELKKKGNNPHLLVMTATPIPRTLAMTAYGDLDVSILNELPAGRKPVLTKLVSDKDLPKVFQFVRQEVKKGRQAYIVYPLVEESEALELKNATRMFEKIQKEIFPDFKVGLLHGQLKGEEKDQIIRRFLENSVQILVATTVIEVGVDVPNSTVMLIEHAERFGLSQLHQLRGRVGRGGEKSYCILVGGWPRSEMAQERLKVMCETHDGFKIAEADLKLRGPGDFLGTRQAGIPDFRIANLIRDLSILEKARKEAFDWLEKDPLLSSPESKSFKSLLEHRWKNRLGLAQIG